jgi:hypothetical protein
VLGAALLQVIEELQRSGGCPPTRGWCNTSRQDQSAVGSRTHAMLAGTHAYHTHIPHTYTH